MEDADREEALEARVGERQAHRIGVADLDRRGQRAEAPGQERSGDVDLARIEVRDDDPTGPELLEDEGGEPSEPGPELEAPRRRAERKVWRHRREKPFGSAKVPA